MKGTSLADLATVKMGYDTPTSSCLGRERLCGQLSQSHLHEGVSGNLVEVQLLLVVLPE
jgi:hypothetical protein